jgi:hypothetical protein
MDALPDPGDNIGIDDILALPNPVLVLIPARSGTRFWDRGRVRKFEPRRFQNGIHI